MNTIVLANSLPWLNSTRFGASPGAARGTVHVVHGGHLSRGRQVYGCWRFTWFTPDIFHAADRWTDAGGSSGSRNPRSDCPMADGWLTAYSCPVGTPSVHLVHAYRRSTRSTP